MQRPAIVIDGFRCRAISLLPCTIFPLRQPGRYSYVEKEKKGGGKSPLSTCATTKKRKKTMMMMTNESSAVTDIQSLEEKERK